MIGYIFLGLLTIFLQGLSRAFLWPLLIVTVASLRKSTYFVYTTSVILGILTDAITGRLLGETAIFLLLSTFALKLLQSRFLADIKIILVSVIFLEIIYFLLASFGF